MPIPSPIQIALMNTATTRADDIITRFSHTADQAENKKRESLAARAVLRKILSETTGTDPQSWSFQRYDNGKPYACFQDAPSPFAISLSHSGSYVACTVAQAEALGIDIEVQRDTRDLEGVSSIAFGPKEREIISREGLAAFYRIWTLREAHSKAIGAGLAQAADGIDRFIAPLPAGSLQRMDETQGPWYISHDEPIAGLHLALAVKFTEAPEVLPVLVRV